VFHSAYWVSKGGIVDLVVVGVERIMKLDERLVREQSVIVLYEKS